MRKGLAVVCVLAGASLVAPAAAAVSSCNDGVDNDGDGAADGQDSGCSPPYNLDDSEENVWDTDATTLFDGNSIFDAPGDSISLLVPGRLNDGEDGSLQDFSSSPPEEGFVEGPGDDISDKYGQGSFGSTTSPAPNSWDVRSTGFLGLFGAQEYVDPPRGDDCGDGDDDGESSLDCPTDVGMAEDVGSSDQSVSQIEGKWEVGTSNANSRIEIEEAEGTKSCDMDGGCFSIDSNPLPTYTGGPNYFIAQSSSNQLREISKPGTGTTTLGSTTDYDLEYTSYSVVQSTGSATDQSCTTTGNYSCNLDSSNIVTTSKTETSHDLYGLEPDEDVHQATTSDFELTSNGVGYSLNENTDTLRLEVAHDDRFDTGNDFIEESPGGSTTIRSYSCSLDGTTEDSTCDISNTGTYTTYQFTTSSPKPTGTTSSQEIFRYENVPSSGWPKSTFLDLNNEVTGVVGEDYGTVHHKKEGGTGYFSVDPGRDSVDFGNNRAFGWSTFDLTMDGDEFATERTGSEAYEPDGNNGEGDTLVAVHEGEIVGDSSNFGTYLSRSDISVTCPGDYTKCVAAIDVSLNSFDTWNSYNNPSSGAEYTVVARAGLGEGLSACKMYQELNEQGESVQCTYEDGSSPLPYGPYTDKSGEYKAKFDGPAADTTVNSDNPVFAEHQISENQCVFNGTVYDEGSLKDIGAEVTLASGDQNVEEGGYNLDQEVCLNMDSDIQGEWHDLDRTEVNNYIASNGFSVSTGESVDSLIITNPDEDADSSTGVVKQGASVEDDCYSSLNCGDNGPPYFVPFYEGAVTADYNPLSSGGDVDGDGDEERQIDIQKWKDEHPLPASLSAVGGQAGPPSGIEDIAGGPPEQLDGNLPRGTQSAQEAEGVHNTVNTSEGSDHGSGTGQTSETDLDLGPLENSQINGEDDEWSLSPNLSYVVDNSGRSLKVSKCHGQPREQGADRNKRQRNYANSYANSTPQGGEWVNPDNTKRTVERGGKTCDLTGKDWGIAYDTFPGSSGDTGALPEEGGSIGGITFVGKGKLMPPSSAGEGSQGQTDSASGTASNIICLGTGCDRSKGSPTSEDTDDTTVDDTGDTMDGTLETGKLKNNGDLCVGSNCVNDDHINDGAEPLGSSNQEGDSADIVLPDVYPINGNLCAGSRC